MMMAVREGDRQNWVEVMQPLQAVERYETVSPPTVMRIIGMAPRHGKAELVVRPDRLDFGRERQLAEAGRLCVAASRMGDD